MKALPAIARSSMALCLALGLTGAARSLPGATPDPTPSASAAPAARGADAQADPPDLQLSRLAAQHLLLADERKMFVDAARTAWRYGERYYRGSTGLVAAVPFYDYATVWDLGSSLAMLYCARELGFLEGADYVARQRQALRTLQRLTLFENAAFNKAYQVSTGAIVDRRQRQSGRGYGWSVTDIGRLLIWLRIVADRDRELATDAAAVVSRLQFGRLVRDGYLWGEDVAPDGSIRKYVEGQIGYEQYAARGFALWDQPPAKALRMSENAIPIEVMGRTLVADARQRDKLTSEPFVLLGLETGWAPDERQLAREVLAAQIERARRTGVITIMSEDALNEPPHFFYYYCLFANGLAFSVDVQDPTAVVTGPRWVSTKAAYGWHALFPSSYTYQAIKAVQPARAAEGWSSGVYERTAQSTGTQNVNTAAVVMTSALYALRGVPVIHGSAVQGFKGS